MVEPVIIGDCQLYLGDCMDILPTLGRVDAVVTDPPYGIGERQGTISKERNRNSYCSFDDTEENVGANVVPAFKFALSISQRAVVTTGTRCLWMYPPAITMGMIFQPAATGMTHWGRGTCQPVLFYGKDPRAGKTIQPIHFKLTEHAEPNGHPCPKPLPVTVWMVDRGSLYAEKVLDPFMGSGTTGVACVKLGRKFIGIEREPKYFDIACRRIEEAYRQPDMFIDPPKKPIQEALL